MSSPDPAVAATDLPPPEMLDVGDPSVPFELQSDGGKPVNLRSDHLAGRPIVLLFYSDAGGAAALGELLAFRDRFQEFEALETKILCIRVAGADDNSALRRAHGIRFPILADPDGRVTGIYRPPSTGAAAVLLDTSQRIAAMLPGAAARPLADRLLDQIGALMAERPITPIGRHPPVLVIPRVLSPQECRWLIDIYATEGQTWRDHREIAAQGYTEDFKTRVPDYGRADRIDHVVNNPATLRRLAQRFARRIIPEIQKAFQYKVTRREYLRITCYEGRRGGIAVGHRDNPTTELAHRRFACSINLNSEEFEGGELRFREYGEHRYKPDSGSALVFSSSILHEALAVTAGRRMVLLTQLFGET